MRDGQAYLVARWYKRLVNLRLEDLNAEAFLRVKTVSLHSGVTYQYRMLKVMWPVTFCGMPFTLWITLDAGVEDGRVVEIQGRRLVDGDERRLMVRLSGTITMGPASSCRSSRT